MKKFFINISIQYSIITLSTLIAMAVFQMLSQPLFTSSVTPFIGLGVSCVLGLIAFLTLPVIALSVMLPFKLSTPGLLLQTVFGTVTGSLSVYLSYLLLPAIYVSNFSCFSVICFSFIVTATIFLISFASRFMDVRKTALWPKR